MVENIANRIKEENFSLYNLTTNQRMLCAWCMFNLQEDSSVQFDLKINKLFEKIYLIIFNL